jgi:two-component system response regulator (stage 0 sporulation protein F)
MPFPTILVVDDDPGLRSLLEEVLVDQGYEVVTADDGASAVRAVLAREPDLILLDMRLPIMTGWDVAHELRARGYRTPVIVMTAALSSENWAAEVGAVGYLAKPFDIDALIAIVDENVPRRPRSSAA